MAMRFSGIDATHGAKLGGMRGRGTVRTCAVRFLALAITAGFGLWPATTASAIGAGFAASIQPDCVLAGQSLTITSGLLGAPAELVVRATFSDSNPSGGQATAVGLSDAQGNFSATLTIPSTARPGTASILVLLLGLGIADAEGASGQFTIGATPADCPSPGTLTLFGAHFSGAASYPVQKTCDPGISGNAVFDVTATLTNIGTFSLLPLTLACNGPAGFLPAMLIFATTVTLHESVVPSGAMAAPDMTFALPPPAVPLVVHNVAACSTTGNDDDTPDDSRSQINHLISHDGPHHHRHKPPACKTGDD
jgi:hypothetical protein